MGWVVIGWLLTWAEHHHQAMADPAMADETVGMLGEEGLRAGGQALRLG